MSNKQKYSSPVREEQKRQTRRDILDALVRVVIDEGVHAFSVSNVAKKAGVSHRTVYRHFATREELLEGLADDLHEDRPADLPSGVPDLDEASSVVQVMFRALSEAGDAPIAEFITLVALRHMTRGKLDRWTQLKRTVAERFPALSADEQLEGAAALRLLLGSNAWFHLCVQVGLPVERATAAVSRTIQLVVEDLERRNADSGQG